MGLTSEEIAFYTARLQAIARAVMPDEKPFLHHPTIDDGMFFVVKMDIQRGRYIVTWSTLIASLEDTDGCITALERSIQQHGWAGLIKVARPKAPLGILTLEASAEALMMPQSAQKATVSEAGASGFAAAVLDFKQVVEGDAAPITAKGISPEEYVRHDSPLAQLPTMWEGDDFAELQQRERDLGLNDAPVTPLPPAPKPTPPKRSHAKKQPVQKKID